MAKRLSRLLLFGFVLLGIGGGYLLWQVDRWLDTPLALEAPLTYELAPGSNFIRVVNDLARQGVVDRPRWLRWYGRLSGQASRIKAGEYLFEPGVTPRGLLEVMVRGRVRQHALTIIEGWNFRQLMAAVNAHPALRHTLQGLDDAAIMARIGHPGEHPEGRFLPDTYHFPRGMTDADFLARAHAAMDRVLAEEWANRAPNLPLKTPYEALILASIVEKETGLASERSAIAGVFIRRLEKGMRLQTDPTVIYGMGDAYRGNIRKQDLLTDTPYNTYRRAGLPPTPIAMPGRDAIHATLHPDDSDNLYFVSRGDGSHHFSATLEEHNRAVIKYQLKGRRKPFSSYNPGS